MINFGNVTQLGYLCDDIEAAMQTWSENSGVGPFTWYKDLTLDMVYKGSPSSVDMHVAIAYRGDMQIELIQQVNDAPSPYKAYFDTKQMGLHHIAFMVDDMDDALAQLRDHKFEITATIDNGDAGRYAYYEDPALDGVIYELLSVNDGMKAYWDSLRVDAEKWDGKPSVTVLG